MNASPHAVHACEVPSVYPHVKQRRGGPCTKRLLRPQVEAYYSCRGRGRPEARGMHARTCPEAEWHVRAYMSEAEVRPRPRQA
eukprot:358464-Chlamydomonas_euryale.AAC.5